MGYNNLKMTVDKLPNPNRGFRYLVLGVVIIGAIALGLLANYTDIISFGNNDSVIPTSNREIIITNLLVGTVDESQITAKNPSVVTKPSYFSNEPIAIKIEATENFTDPIQINARLLTSTGAVVELDPPSIMLQPPGNNTFCCWVVSQPGEFSLQLFRPEKIITTVPIKIRQAHESDPRAIDLLR